MGDVMGDYLDVMRDWVRLWSMGAKPYTDLQIRQAKAQQGRQKLPCGDGLYLIVESISRAANSKSFIGRIRFPYTRTGKQIEVRIGVYGKGINQYSLKEAKEEWLRLRKISKQENKDPRDIQKEEKGINSYKKSPTKTLGKVIEIFWEEKVDEWATTTADDYKNKIHNQILPVLGANTPIDAFDWENDGRTKLLDLKKGIENRGSKSQADKVFMLCRMIFDFAIDRGWMKDQNPARTSTHTRSTHKKENNPSLDWDELPVFFNAFEENEPNANEIVRSATKLLFLTALRVGSLVGMRFDEVDYENGLINVPAKRMKSKEDLQVPLTPEIKKVIKQMKSFNGHQEYVFYSARGSKNEFMNPSSPNTLIKRLGYKGKLTAHGIRAIFLTAGHETLGFDKNIIRIQMGHAIGDPVERSYLHAKFWKPRIKFMNAWNKALLERGLEV